MTAFEPAGPRLVLVNLSFTAHIRGSAPGFSFSSSSDSWMGWVIEAPADWSAFRAALNEFCWPEPFSRDPSKIVPYGPQPIGFGANAPMFSISASRLPILDIGLEASLAFEPGAFNEAAERALWALLRREAEPRLLALMAGLSPLPLGLLEAGGSDEPRLFAATAASQWMSRRERDDLADSIPPLAGAPAPSL